MRVTRPSINMRKWFGKLALGAFPGAGILDEEDVQDDEPMPAESSVGMLGTFQAEGPLQDDPLLRAAEQQERPLIEIVSR